DLYKKGFLMPLLKCLGPGEAEAVLREIHEGDCGSHIGARNLAKKVIGAGFYWPRLFQEAVDYVQRCSSCQHNATIHRLPASSFAGIIAPWPFAEWGIDLMGPFP
ncbi:hypothetical protein JJ728_23320, partial [Salmonella enterica subsp. enterica serovar Typhi]|nr:hypothetical protein [Salmonella enterica subsp. enterica serovar Typhi]